MNFQNKAILVTALTRKSYLNENKVDWGSNERLEFLGDSVLQLIVSDKLYLENNADEGALTECRKTMVMDAAIAEKAKNLHIKEHLLIGEGEKEKLESLGPEFYANIFEALVGAVYLDTRCLAGVRVFMNRIDELQRSDITGELL